MKLDDNGDLDYSFDPYAAPAPPKKGKINPLTGLPDDGTGTGSMPDETAPPANSSPTVTDYFGPGNENTNTTPQPSGGGAFVGGDNSLLGALNSPGADVPSLLNLFNTANNRTTGNQATYYNDSRGETIGLPSGYYAKTPSGWTWTDRGPEGAAGSAGGGGSSAAGSGSTLSDFLSQLLAQKGGGSDTSAARTSILSRLTALADKYSQPVTADDPDIASATNAYTGQVGRSLNMFKKTAAERAYAEGVPTGSFDSQIGNADMAGGRAVGDMQTQMMHDEMLSRRDALTQTLTQSAGLLSQQDALDMQNKIASIDAALKAAGIDVTSQLGNKGLDLQSLLGQGALNNQSTQIGNQNNQFYDNLSISSAHDQALLQYLYQALGING